MITLSEFKKAYSKAIQEGYAAIFAGAALCANRGAAGGGPRRRAGYARHADAGPRAGRCRCRRPRRAGRKPEPGPRL